MNKILLIATLLLQPLLCNPSQAQSKELNQKEKELISARQIWVDSVYNQLNLQERIGQLFMVAAYSGGPNYNQAAIQALVDKNQIGGIIFMQGTPEAQAVQTNTYQQTAKVPLLIGMDAEWGLGMRLTAVQDYPQQMLLGATNNPALVKEMGRLIALQCKRLGVHIDFAPVVDVNNNPMNPVINFRSFGEDKNKVSRLGIAYMKGLQENGIMASAKHFPGHGDVSVDSHLDLPIIVKSREELMDMEFYPFRKLIDAGVQSVMISHLSVPSIDPVPNRPATLSKEVVTGVLRDEWGYEGLIITDALNMKGVTKGQPGGEVDLKAFLAGNDVLLFSENVPLGIQKIEQAIANGVASKEQLEKSVKKILAAKYEAGLPHFKPIKTEGLVADLNAHTNTFWTAAAQAAVTLKGAQNPLFDKLKQKGVKVAYLELSVKDGNNYFKDQLTQKFPGLQILNSPIGLEKYDVVLVGIRHLYNYPGKSGAYGLSVQQVSLLKQLAKKENVLFNLFGNPYLMKYFCEADAGLIVYEDNTATQNAVLDVLVGAAEARGQLPVSACR